MHTEPEYKKYILLIAKKKNTFVVVALAVMTCAVILSYLLPKKYQAGSTVFIERNVVSEFVKGIAVTPSVEEALKGLTVDMTARSLLVKVIEDVGMNKSSGDDDSMAELIRKIQKNTAIRMKDNKVFTITYTDENPYIARDFVNALLNRYIEQNNTSKREESLDAINFLATQMDTFRDKLNKSEEELTRYKTRKGVAIAVDEGRLFEEINHAQQKLYDLQLRRRHLEQLRPVTRKAADPLQIKLVSLQKQLEELRITYTDTYPEVERVKGELETLKQQLKERKYAEEVTSDPQEVEKVEAELQALRLSEEGLKRHIASNEALLRDIPFAKAGLEKLESEKTNRKALYEQLMTRHGQSEVSKQVEVQDKATTFRVVDRASLPTAPISPNRPKIMFMGIFAGIGAALMWLIATDYIDESVKSVEELRDINCPVLAVIPKIRTLEAEMEERAKWLRTYISAAVYLTLLLVVMLLEWAGKSPVDQVFANVQTLL